MIFWILCVVDALSYFVTFERRLIWRFAGIVTRRPLVLQLHKIDSGQQEYAEFLHLPKRRFNDFGMHIALSIVYLVVKI